MRENIHPEYHDVTITCACGATYPTKSTKEDYRVEIIGNPFHNAEMPSALIMSTN